MTHVTEHDTKEEREGHNRQIGGVCLLVLWDTIRVYYLLKGKCEFIGLDISRSCNVVILVPDHAHCRELTHFLHEARLQVSRRPEIAEESCVLHLHHIQGAIQSFLFREEHFVNIDGRNLILLLVIHVKFVENDQLVSQRRLSLLEYICGILNTLAYLCNFHVHLAHLWQLVPISSKGIADSLNLFSDSTTVPEHNHVNGFGSSCDLVSGTLIEEILGEDEGFTFSCTEDQSL